MVFQTCFSAAASEQLYSYHYPRDLGQALSLHAENDANIEELRQKLEAQLFDHYQLRTTDTEALLALSASAPTRKPSPQCLWAARAYATGSDPVSGQIKAASATRPMIDPVRSLLMCFAADCHCHSFISRAIICCAMSSIMLGDSVRWPGKLATGPSRPRTRPSNSKSSGTSVCRATALKLVCVCFVLLCGCLRVCLVVWLCVQISKTTACFCSCFLFSSLCSTSHRFLVCILFVFLFVFHSRIVFCCCRICALLLPGHAAANSELGHRGHRHGLFFLVLDLFDCFDAQVVVCCVFAALTVAGTLWYAPFLLFPCYSLFNHAGTCCLRFSAASATQNTVVIRAHTATHRRCD